MRRALVALAVILAISACSTPESDEGAPLVVTTSSITADLVSQITGETVDVVSLIPNGFDSHTYEPKPSELALLSDADMIVVADATLNSGITQLAQLSGDASRMLDLNEAALSQPDLIGRPSSNGWNPHTWTDPNLVIKWLDPLVDRLTGVAPEHATLFAGNAERLRAELEALDADIDRTLSAIPDERRKLVVYHDAWEYFGRAYDLEVVGTLQALSFAEPSAQQIADMAEQIRRENVPAFFGSEVFPSDVMDALEKASGADYIPELADDRLLGNPGDPEYGYVPLMRSNVNLLLQGLS